MSKPTFKLFFIIIFICLSITTSYSQEISTFFTNKYPPISMKKGKKNIGLGCDLIKELNKRNKTKSKVTFGIWNTIYKKALQSKSTGVFPTTRTKDREKSFFWVGPFCSTEYYVYMANTNKQKISTKEDIKNAKSIATYKGYSLNEFLIAQGCKNLVYFDTPKEAALAVILGKCDICIFPSFVADNFHKQSGYIINSVPEPIKDTGGLGALIRGDNGIQLTYGNTYETYDEVVKKSKTIGHKNIIDTKGRPNIIPVFLYMKEDLYFAINHDSSDKTVENLQKTLFSIYNDGTLLKLYNKYNIPQTLIPKITPTLTSSKQEKSEAPHIILSTSESIKNTDEIENAKNKFLIYAENFPPLTFKTKDSTNVQGASIELLTAIENELKIEHAPVILDDWNIMFNKAKSTPYSILCALKRIPERENDFYWIGPYAADSAWLYSRRDFNNEINNIEEAKNIEEIACITKTFAHTVLLNEGFKNIITYNTPDDTVHKMLESPKYAAAFSSISAPYMIRNAGYSPIDIKPLLQLSKKTNYYIGISKSTPKEVALRWENAFENVKKREKLKNILNKWIK